jgi:hypothetical protein
MNLARVAALKDVFQKRVAQLARIRRCSDYGDSLRREQEVQRMIQLLRTAHLSIVPFLRNSAEGNWQPLSLKE